jgi:hypothetical protein
MEHAPQTMNPFNWIHDLGSVYDEKDIEEAELNQIRS